MNLVFASGFLVPQHLLGIDYFHGVSAHLAGRHETLFPFVPPFGTAEERARVLADAIDQKFRQGPVHIIAHSMGGLDGRVLIARNHHGLSDPGRIASLTMLSTPHRGSPIADLLAGPKPGGLRRLTYELISQTIAGLGIPAGAIANLTTESASRVPDVATSHAHIRYRSYAATGRPRTPPTCFLLALTHHYIHEVTGEENDGAVAVGSAKYGEFQEPPWRCDHFDMIGHNLDGVGPRFDHLAHIDAIIERL